MNLDRYVSLLESAEAKARYMQIKNDEAQIARASDIESIQEQSMVLQGLYARYPSIFRPETLHRKSTVIKVDDTGSNYYTNRSVYFDLKTGKFLRIYERDMFKYTWPITIGSGFATTIAIIIASVTGNTPTSDPLPTVIFFSIILGALSGLVFFTLLLLADAFVTNSKYEKYLASIPIDSLQNPTEVQRNLNKLLRQLES